MSYVNYTDKFFIHFYNLLKSNLSYVEALVILRSTSTKGIQKIASSILSQLNLGYTLTQSMNLTPNLKLSEQIKQLLQAGECTSKVLEVLDLIIRQTNVKKKNKDEIINTLMYPFFVFFLGLIGSIIFINLKKILFTGISTSLMMSVIVRALMVFFFLIFLFGIYIYHSLKQPNYFLLYYTLGFLQDSGFSFIRSFELSMGIYTQEKIRTNLYDAYKRIKEGEKISKSFDYAKLSKKEYSLIIEIGEKTGAMSNTCNQIAEDILTKYNKRKEFCIKTVEPVSLFVVSVYLMIVLNGIFVPYITNLGGIL